MNLFDGLEQLGFSDTTGIDLFNRNSNANKKGKHSHITVPDDPLDFLYAKTFTCPVCDKDFTSQVVRKSKIKLMQTDTDLKVAFEPVDPNRYDVHLCSHCGYAALHSYFNRISDKQIELILQKIKPNYRPKEYAVVLSPEEAIERYKVALLNAAVKGVKSSEKGIICLKTAWLYRDLNDTANEQLFLKAALEGLKEAYNTESFPLGTIDENTAQYLIGEIARRTGDFSEAMKWISAVVLNPGVTKSLKNRALMVKELIREGKKA